MLWFWNLSLLPCFKIVTSWLVPADSDSFLLVFIYSVSLYTLLFSFFHSTAEEFSDLRSLWFGLLYIFASHACACTHTHTLVHVLTHTHKYIYVSRQSPECQPEASLWSSHDVLNIILRFKVILCHNYEFTCLPYSTEHYAIRILLLYS